MKTYEFVTSERTTFYIVCYSMIITALFCSGKVITMILSLGFPGELFELINSLFWPVLGLLIAGFFVAITWKNINRQVTGGIWVITANRFFNRDHCYIYPTGDHVCNLLEKEVFKNVSLFKKKEAKKGHTASTLDDDIVVDYFYTVQAISPVFVFLDETDPAKTAIELADAIIQENLEAYTRQLKSDDVVGWSADMTAYIQSYLNQEPRLYLNGLSVEVSTKNQDFSPEVSEARKFAKQSTLFDEAVKQLAGHSTVLRDPVTGGIVVDANGQPIIVPADITTEEAGGLLLALQGKGSKIERKIQEIVIKGDPAVLTALRHSGIYAGIASDHEGGL